MRNFVIPAGEQASARLINTLQEMHMKTLIFWLVAICALSFGQSSIAADQNPDSDAVTYRPDITFTLRTDIAEGKLVFVGETDAIAGKINPDLNVPEGAVV